VRRRSWIDTQLVERGISDPRVLDAMARVPRELFVPARDRKRAYDDEALALSHGQTISQPFIVALICEALSLTGGDKVLDVGTGSGYQAAVLAELGTHVVSIERIRELAERARERLAEGGYDVEVRIGDGSLGAPDRAPFDGIAVAAAAAAVPPALAEQLAPDGRLVLPLGEHLVRVTHDGVEELAPARFVPLVTGFSPDAPGMTGSQ
jgi:protein-L-isoaspartate(D-aspartate) O-methyltransferase